MKLIGLTGTIASGKTTVSEYLIQKGYKIIDADKISHKVTNIGNRGYKAILKLFPQVIDAENNIDRKKLSGIVFSDKNQLQLLNEALHPIILDEIDNKIKESQSYHIVFLDAPLLFETGLDKKCDLVLLIAVDEQIQIQRLTKRDGIDIFTARKIIASQMGIEKRIEKSDVVIYNNEDLVQLKLKIDEFLLRIDKGN
ncbi:dephospho-CoA kinase [Criibacterium bergeronii]|uniref:Dephospho-CoA kinase n=1 Tax=Criibacterium bergeronii TaxID=1871336 RepID=A0A552VCK8_9FIRM|nr:dephospho-CoA kinase [Criibacterium bergeronii]MBS6062881.1 dephospho-CoA kinase [Peptostreptococcaceae bacterium]TRW28208.1 dephospho-CoA kinase [Criibacterium bergeronii]